MKEFLLSLFVHLSLFVMLITPSCGGKGQSEQDEAGKNKNNGEDSRQIVPKGKPSSAPLQIEIVESFKKKEDKPGEDCPNGQWFGGIGIYEDSTGPETTIIQVVDGYPAQKAGLQLGDVIIYPATYLIRGDVGTILSITVKRNGKYINFQIVRDKICVK